MPPLAARTAGIGKEWVTHRSNCHDGREERTEMNKESSAPLRGNELLERLFELEATKKEALIEFDADSFETAVAEQTSLVSRGTLDKSELSRERVVAFAAQTRLNLALLLNLISISPYFRLMKQGYTAEGIGENAPKQHVTVEG